MVLPTFQNAIRRIPLSKRIRPDLAYAVRDSSSFFSPFTTPSARRPVRQSIQVTSLSHITTRLLATAPTQKASERESTAAPSPQYDLSVWEEAMKAIGVTVMVYTGFKKIRGKVVDSQHQGQDMPKENDVKIKVNKSSKTFRENRFNVLPIVYKLAKKYRPVGVTTIMLLGNYHHSKQNKKDHLTFILYSEKKPTYVAHVLVDKNMAEISLQIGAEGPSQTTFSINGSCVEVSPKTVAKHHQQLSIALDSFKAWHSHESSLAKTAEKLARNKKAAEDARAAKK